MSLTDPHYAEMLRQGFKHFNRFMLWMWRLGLGSWLNMAPALLGRYLVIVHTGRKTGLRRFTPVNYARIDGAIYCTAGFGQQSDWYRNIQANPAVEVWLPNGWWTATAEEASDEPGRVDRLRAVLFGSGFVAPLMEVDPRRLHDAALDQATRDYRLVRLRLGMARTGDGGPGEYLWVWPLLAMVMLPLALRGLRRR
jgi:deazaflavin-dependent oxidoreductase (nitroreductase family)